MIGRPLHQRSVVVNSRDPAIRRGKNALPAADRWPTFTFPASGKDIAIPYASSAFLSPPLSRRLEGSPLLTTTERRDHLTGFTLEIHQCSRRVVRRSSLGGGSL